MTVGSNIEAKIKRMTRNHPPVEFYRQAMSNLCPAKEANACFNLINDHYM